MVSLAMCLDSLTVASQIKRLARANKIFVNGELHDLSFPFTIFGSLSFNLVKIKFDCE